MVLSDAKKSVSLLDENISFDLERLFDEYNMDHIPEEQRLDQFKQRDISYVKYYKSAVKIFGGPISRRRVIIAPPMETPTKHRIGFYMNKQQFPPNQILHNAVMPSGDVKLTSCEPQQSRLACLDKDTEDAIYSQWLAGRQCLRRELESFGSCEKYLRSKVDKTDLEKRVLAKLIEELQKSDFLPPSPLFEDHDERTIVIPKLQVPLPPALQVLDQYLADKHLRLIDLFRAADQNQDWKLTEEKLTSVARKNKINISVTDIEDLIVTLDSNVDQMLEYKDIAKGMRLLKAERRAQRRLKGHSAIAQFSVTSLRNSSSLLQVASTSKGINRFYGSDWVPLRAGSGAKSICGLSAPCRNSSGSKSSLELPSIDLRPEERVSSSEEMVELRKHDEAVLQRIKHQKWVSPLAVYRSLLYCPDMPRPDCLSKIRQPQELFHRPSKPLMGQRLKTGPSPGGGRAPGEVNKDDLTTGLNAASYRDNTWISIEEYDRYTRYELNTEKFWPGHMLNKLVSFEPGDPSYQRNCRKGQNSIFHRTDLTLCPRAKIGMSKIFGPPINNDGHIIENRRGGM